MAFREGFLKEVMSKQRLEGQVVVAREDEKSILGRENRMGECLEVRGHGMVKGNFRSSPGLEHNGRCGQSCSMQYGNHGSRGLEM